MREIPYIILLLLNSWSWTGQVWSKTRKVDSRYRCWTWIGWRARDTTLQSAVVCPPVTTQNQTMEQVKTPGIQQLLPQNKTKQRRREILDLVVHSSIEKDSWSIDDHTRSSRKQNLLLPFPINIIIKTLAFFFFFFSLQHHKRIDIIKPKRNKRKKQIWFSVLVQNLSKAFRIG